MKENDKIRAISDDEMNDVNGGIFISTSFTKSLKNSVNNLVAGPDEANLSPKHAVLNEDMGNPQLLGSLPMDNGKNVPGSKLVSGDYKRGSC